MIGLIVIGALLVVIEGIGVWVALQRHSYNDKVNAKNIDLLTKENLLLSEELKLTKKELVLLAHTKVSSNAFALTFDGVKILPEDWWTKCFGQTREN